MNLKSLINKSYYGSVGYINNLEDLTIVEQYIQYNLEILREYKGIIVAASYNDFKLSNQYHLLWKRYFPNAILLDDKLNRGHNFGTSDKDNIIFDYCKNNNLEWLCKSANDIILEKEILEIPIKKSDFYYMNGIGYGGMVGYNFDLDKIEIKDFYPQTNFYFINTSKTDYLNNKKYVDETYEYIQTLPDYNGKVWEYIEGWSCEDFLKNCVIRNNLSKYHLVPPKKYRILLETVKRLQIHDCSHKNIMIEGICHFQYPNHPITVI